MCYKLSCNLQTKHRLNVFCVKKNHSKNFEQTVKKSNARNDSLTLIRRHRSLTLFQFKILLNCVPQKTYHMRHLFGHFLTDFDSIFFAVRYDGAKNDFITSDLVFRRIFLKNCMFNIIFESD